jgi:hypothetical protein
MKLFILMTVLLLQSCSMTYEKNFVEEGKEEREHRTYEAGTFR